MPKLQDAYDVQGDVNGDRRPPAQAFALIVLETASEDHVAVDAKPDRDLAHARCEIRIAL